MTSRVAAIDCGTNSIRLLVADVDPVRRTLTDVDRRLEIVRLGQGVDKTGRLAPEALERTLGALREYAGIIRASRVDNVRMVAHVRSERNRSVRTRVSARLEPFIRETLDIPALRTDLVRIRQCRFHVGSDPVREIVVDRLISDLCA